MMVHVYQRSRAEGHYIVALPGFATFVDSSDGWLRGDTLCDSVNDLVDAIATERGYPDYDITFWREERLAYAPSIAEVLAGSVNCKCCGRPL